MLKRPTFNLKHQIEAGRVPRSNVAPRSTKSCDCGFLADCFDT